MTHKPLPKTIRIIGCHEGKIDSIAELSKYTRKDGSFNSTFQKMLREAIETAAFVQIEWLAEDEREVD